MSYTERQIAEELREMYPELSVFESLQIAVGVRHNDLIYQAFDIRGSGSEGTSIFIEIANNLDSIASTIDTTVNQRIRPTGGPPRKLKRE